MIRRPGRERTISDILKRGLIVFALILPSILTMEFRDRAYSGDLVADPASMRRAGQEGSVSKSGIEGCTEEMNKRPPIQLPGKYPSFIGEKEGSASGQSVAIVGDVNGDGFDDILIGAPQYSTESEERIGKIYLIFGTNQALPQSLRDAPVSFVGENATDMAGWCVAGLGDVDNDGYDDFSISATAYGTEDLGKIYVVFGGANASSWRSVNLGNLSPSTSPRGGHFIGESAGDLAGASVVGAGDVNGDGHADILIGAWRNGEGGYYAGKTYLVLGKQNPSWNEFLLEDMQVSDGASFRGAAESWSGYSVAGAGDVNGDGSDDFLIGAPGEANGLLKNAGRVYLVLGNSNADWGLDFNLHDLGTEGNPPGAAFPGEAKGIYCGSSVAGAGRINNDQYDDFIIGAPYFGSDDNLRVGKVYLIHGKPAADWGLGYMLTDTSASSTFKGVAGTEEQAGASAAGVGDTNGDGYDDFAIAAPQHIESAENRNPRIMTYLIQGTDQPWSSPFILSGAAASFDAGKNLPMAISQVNGRGDINGDGYDDFLVGTFLNNDGEAAAGRTFLILGSNGN